MQKLTINEIPLKVLMSVRSKWKRALKSGWNAALWNPCALCEYVGKRYAAQIKCKSKNCQNCYDDLICGHNSCEICPISPDWCNLGNRNTSEISGEYCDIIDEDDCDQRCKNCSHGTLMEQEWSERVTEFIKYINDEIDNRHQKLQLKQLEHFS